MTTIDCPRCHGGKYVEGKGFVEPKGKNPTLRIDRLMGDTQRIYYRCSNCCYRLYVPYNNEGKEMWDKKVVLTSSGRGDNE